MKIVILINELNIRGGTHKQMHQLAEYLVARQHDILIITKALDLNKSYPGTEKLNIRSFNRYYDTSSSGVLNRLTRRIVGAWKISSLAISYGELVNIHDNGFGLVNFFIKLRSRIPVVWQINDLPPVFAVGNSQSTKTHWSYPIRRAFSRSVARNTEVITVNVTKNSLRVKQLLKVDSKVLYCGVELRNEDLDFKTIDDNTITLLSTGVFLEYRNYESFLAVHVELMNRGYNVRSYIVGSTNLNPRYVKKIQDIITHQKLDCSITGDISEIELINVYKKTDFFLFLNIDQSWGLAVFEAMNLGVPVLVSNSVGATELLTHNRDSIVVNPLDVNEITENIEILIKDNEMRQNIVKHAFSLTSSMTWDKMYSSKLESIFYDLVGK